VLHYVAEPAVALTTVSRALRRGGRLVIVDMLPHDRAEYRETMGHLWQGFAHQQLERWATDAGFVGFRAHALPAAPSAKGPTLFVASCSKG
jgi:ArsR family transcriptional regulator